MVAGYPNRLEVRVYYEDTDFSGRVYHASFLRFFERGRTEWLRSMGFQHSELARLDGLAFAVTSLQIEFLAAAFIDDCLEVTTEIATHKGARLVFHQCIHRGKIALADGIIEIVTLRDDRAARPPRALLSVLAELKRQ